MRGPTKFALAQTTEPPEQKPVGVNGVVVGPFEEAEEETCIASDVVKMEGEVRPPQVVGGRTG